MDRRVFVVVFYAVILPGLVRSASPGFSFEGFSSASGELELDSVASVTPEGLLMLTPTETHVQGHAFYRSSFPFRNSTTGSALSFSASFVFAIVSKYPTLGGNGIAFVVAGTTNFALATGSQYLGLVNSSNNGNATNQLLAVELDTIFNPDIGDLDDNHVGIDLNGVRSIASNPAGYYPSSDADFNNLTLISGEPMQIWVDYDSTSHRMDVTLSPINMTKPARPLLSSTVDLTTVTSENVYVGFSSSTGSFLASHYILGWSFQLNGKAKPLNISALPELPKLGTGRIGSVFIYAGSAGTLFLVAVGVVAAYVAARRIKFAELVEEWEEEYGQQRFSYYDLYRATDGFSKKRLLGEGGFGRVYRGELRGASKSGIAVKRVTHESKQGMKEFVAELASLGHLRHRNLVQLLGYCRRKRELMLVYEFMPNGSLDRLLSGGGGGGGNELKLTWRQRVEVVRGVACGLSYLHGELEKVVIHRDVKASNVLLDENVNGRLGDFGLARLYDHDDDVHTTHVVGTVGYLAPELTRTGRATKATDVYSFGVLLLEVVTGRSAVEGDGETVVEWVRERWRRGGVPAVVDGRLGGDWDEEEVRTVVEVGLRCCQPVASARPEIKQVADGLRGVVRELRVEMGKDELLAAFMERERMEKTPTAVSSQWETSSVLWSGR